MSRMNYRDLYEYGKRILREAEILEAELDARLLLEHVCDTNRNTLFVHGDREVSHEQKEAYDRLISERARHIPLQHLTGVQEFMGLTFMVNANVLIPRQDTEILVEEAMKELHDGMEILDVCTGSGCILLSLLHYSNDCNGLGLDISESALEVAKQNAGKLSIQADFLQSDLFDKIEAGRKFDMLVSNPPYIPTDVIPTLMEEVRVYEPVNALDGLEDGLFFYRKISKEAKAYLRKGAYLFFEIGCEQAEAVREILEKEGYKEIEIIKDLAGLDRVAKCIFY